MQPGSLLRICRGRRGRHCGRRGRHCGRYHIPMGEKTPELSCLYPADPGLPEAAQDRASHGHAQQPEAAPEGALQGAVAIAFPPMEPCDINKGGIPQACFNIYDVPAGWVVLKKNRGCPGIAQGGYIHFLIDNYPAGRKTGGNKKRAREKGDSLISPAIVNFLQAHFFCSQAVIDDGIVPVDLPEHGEIKRCCNTEDHKASCEQVLS